MARNLSGHLKQSKMNFFTRCRKIIFDYLRYSNWKSNTINSLIWMEQQSSLISGLFNFPFVTSAFILPDSLQSLLGHTFCKWIPLSGKTKLHYKLVINVASSWTKAWSSDLGEFRVHYYTARDSYESGKGQKVLTVAKPQRRYNWAFPISIPIYTSFEPSAGNDVVRTFNSYYHSNWKIKSFALFLKLNFNFWRL